MAFFIARDLFYGYTFFLMAAVYLDIPVPPIHRLNDGGTQKDRVSALLDIAVPKDIAL